MPPECKTQGSGAAVQQPSATQPSGTAAGTASTATTPSTVAKPETAPSTAATTTSTPPSNSGLTATAATAPSGSVLASEFMGQTVYNVTGDSIGKINDLVMTRNLDNILAIIGVGGFLGIGEKDVGIPISEIRADKDSNGNLKLTINNTKAQLESAPAFDRTALK